MCVISTMTREWFGNDSVYSRLSLGSTVSRSRSACAPRTPSLFKDKSQLSFPSLASLICLCMLTVGVGNAWGDIDLRGKSSALIIPLANSESSYSAGDWRTIGAPTSSGSATCTITQSAVTYGTISLTSCQDSKALESGGYPLQFTAGSGNVSFVIKSDYGVDVVVRCKSKNSNEMTLNLTGADQQYAGTSWGTKTLSTTNTSATLSLASKSGASKACGITYIKITPKTGSTKTLSSIAITTQPTRRKYVVGETFSPSGAVVTATYSDASTKSVSAAWTPNTALSAGTSQTVTASYTEGGTTKTATTTIDVYSITLNAKDESNNVLGALIVTQPTQSGSSLTAAATGNSYTFKQWSVSGASLNDNSSTTPTITAVSGAVTATAVYYAPITVEWYAGGTKIDDETHARGWSLMYPSNPDPDDYGCTGKVFYGWTTEANKDYEHATVAPSLVSSGTAINVNSKFYAVFAESSGGGGVTTTWVLTALSSVTEGIYALATTDGHAFNGTMDSNHHGQVTAQAFSFTDGVATSAPAGTCEITFTAVTGGFTMYNATYGYLYAAAAATKNLYWHAAETSYWKYASTNWTYNANSAYLRSYSNNSLRTYRANNGDVLVLVKKTTSGSEPTYTNFATSCGCEEYSFHTGSSADETLKTTNTQTCFENHPSDANQRIISDYVIPSDTKFFVGKLGYFYDSNLNISGTGSQSVIKQFGAANADNGLYLNYTKGYGDGSRPGVGQATGAIGTLYIDVTSTWHNLHLGFDPNGYIFKLGSTYLTMHDATSGLDATRYKETDVVTLSSTNISGQFQVNIAAVAPNASTGVACAYTETKNLTTMGVKSGSGNNWRGSSINAGADTDTKGFFRIDIGEGNATNWNAHWVPCWELKFDYKGGSGAIATTPAYVSVEGDAAARTVTIPNTAPTKDGYRFMGWSDDDNNTVEYAAGSTHNVTLSGNKIVYAVWKQVYTVTYAYAGGSGSCAAGGPYAEEETVTTCGSATKAGSTLTGWRRSDNDATVTPGNTFAMPASNVTLTAVWEDTPYTLTQNVGSHTTKGHAETTITSGMTSPSGLDLTYSISDNSYALPKTITVSGGGQTWTLGTNYTWELSADKHSATLHIGADLTITADVTVTVTEQARYTVVWDRPGDGNDETEYYAADDNSVTMKTGESDCGTKKFYCWTENPGSLSPTPTAATSGTISGNKTYTAVYGDRSGGEGYEKVTAVQDGATYYIATGLTSGDYGCGGQNGSNSYADAVSLSTATFNGSSVLTAFPSGVKAITVAVSGNYFSMYDGTKYLTLNSNSNALDYANSAAYVWELTASDSYIKPKDYSRWIMRNSARFACYSNAQDKSYAYLYKPAVSWSNFSTSCELYEISIDTPDGGTVTTSPASETGSGATVTVNVTPNSCKYLSALKYNDGSDHAISIASTPYTFTMPASDVTVTATFSNKSVSSIALNTNTHRTLMQGTAFEGEQIRVTYNNGETEDLAWDDATLTFSGYNMSTLGNQTVTVTYTGCGTTTTTYSITITDGIPVTFSDCGITTVRKYDPGQTVPVESIDGAYGCSGWVFAGWSETSVAANSTSYTPVSNFSASTAKTLYAVYSKEGSTWLSAFDLSEMRSGAKYVIVKNYSAGNQFALTNAADGSAPNYLDGSQLATDCEAVREPGTYNDRYRLTVTPTASMIWVVKRKGEHWTIYSPDAEKYLKITSDGYTQLTTACEDEFVLTEGYNDSEIDAESTNASGKHLSWYNSSPKYWNGYGSAASNVYWLTNNEQFSSTPPCAPRSVEFHGNGGQITKYGESTDEGDPVELTITEASRDAGIRLPSARFADCNGKSWTFVGWSDAEIDVTRVPVLTTELLEDGVAGASHSIATDDEEYWAVFTNQGAAETKYGTISFAMSDFNKAYSSSEHTTTKTVSTMGDYTFGYVYLGHQSDVGIQFNEDAGELYNKTSLGKVNSISFTTFSFGDINKIKVYVGDEEKSTDHLLSAAEMQNVGSTWTYYPNDDESYVYITNAGKGNGSYVCVTGISIDFGKGTEVWATTPDCSIISLSGTVKVTSTSGQKVKATTPITVTGKDLTPSTALSFKAYNVSDDTENSNFTFVGSVNTDGSGNISSTTITVAYQPTATTDGIEEVYFRATDGTTNSNKLNGYGRHLPAKFLIATKVGDDWYALPNNTSSYGNPAAVKLSSVNESTGVATYYSDQYDGEAVGSKNYLTWTMNAVVNGSEADYGYTNHGNRVRFKDSKDNKYLEFGTGDDVGKIKNSRASSTPASVLHLASELLPTTSDLVDYTLQNEGQSKYLGVNGSQLWGAYAGSTTVRFLIPDQQPAATITWYNDMLGANHTTNKAENGVVTLPTGDDPESCNEPSGLLTFDGWVTATWTGYKTTGFTKVVGGEVATSNTTYYAVFKTGDNKYYTKCPTIYSITYTPNGGTGSNYVTYTMNTTADAVTVETAGFEKSGSTFVGWTNPSDGEGTIITPGAGRITGLSGDITLNAVWIGTVSVTGTVRLTTAAGEKVATGATDVTISSTDLACATALRITYKDVTNDVTYGRSGSPSYTSSEFRLCNGSYGAADLSNISLAEVSGAYNQTFSMTYEPNGGANTLDEYQLKVEVLLKNTVIDTKTLSLYGRTLPASFAIAIKVGGSWYALPNNMGSSGTYDPILISVTEDASVLNWAAQGPSTVAYKMKDYTTNYSKLRFAADDATEYCLWAATGSAAGIRNYSASSTDANYAWTIAETNADFSGYTMANLANTRTALKINDSKWQMYNSGGLSEIHFIPLTTVTPIDVTVMEWGADEIAVKTVANWTPSAITAQISGGSPSAVTKTSIGGDLYKLTGVGDLQGNPGEPLALNVTDGGAKQAIIQIPFIVTDTKTEADLATILKDAGYAATLTEARSLTKNMDVIVRRNGTLSSESSVSGTFQNVYIYPGGKADFTKNISIQNLYMRGGFSWLGGAYAHPQMNVASTASISGIGSTGHGIFYDLYLDNSIYYVFALPKDVSVTTITNEENGDDWDAWIKSYSGEGRTLSPKVSGWSYVTSGSIARGAGYEIAIKPRLNRPYGILRFPLLKSTVWSTETDCTPSVTGWGANNANVSDNNKGWNFIGNPFLTAYNNAATPGSSPSGLIQTKTLVPTDTDPWDGKYQWATSNVKYFTVPRYTEYEYDDIRAYPYKLDAFFPFFIQVTGDGTVSFDDANKALKTPARYAGEPVREVFVDFQLNNSNGQSDVAGLTISDQYSDEFDMNDKEKTIQNGNNSMKLYTLVGEYRTAFNALTEATAALPIPVGVIAPTAGTYRFAKLEDADYSEVEHLWLTDYLQSRYVDLLVEPFYEFTTEAGRFEDRFAINATLAPKQDTPTDIDGTSEEIDQPVKFIYHDKLYILRNDVIYDATGKKVKGGLK